MSGHVNSERLQFEMARRGWTRRKLARAAGVSASTVNAALCRRGVHPRSLHQMALALEKTTAIDNIDPLIDVTG